jgi:hypothetical protein
VQLDAHARLGRAQRRLEEVAGAELAEGPAKERRPPPAHGGGRRAEAVHGHEQLEGDRTPVRRQRQVGDERGLLAEGRAPAAAGLLQPGQDAGVGAGVEPPGRAEPAGRLVVQRDVVHRPRAWWPDGEARCAVGPGVAHEAVRPAGGHRRPPADAVQPRVAALQVQGPGEGPELAAPHRRRGQPQGAFDLQGVLVVVQRGADGDHPRGRQPVQALLALPGHGVVPGPGDRGRRDHAAQGDPDGHGPPQGSPGSRTATPGAPPQGPSRDHADGIDLARGRLKHRPPVYAHLTQGPATMGAPLQRMGRWHR